MSVGPAVARVRGRGGFLGRRVADPIATPSDEYLLLRVFTLKELCTMASLRALASLRSGGGSTRRACPRTI
eukprot:10195486-Lingulodinium_polyedra.AAC.1